MQLDLLIFFLTIAVGIIGFFVIKGVADPILEYRKLVREIGKNLTFYSHIITSPGVSKQLADDGQASLRRLAGELEVAYLSIPLHRQLFSKIFLVPNEQSVQQAKGNMIFLSNSLHSESNRDNYDIWAEVYRLLKIPQFERFLTKKELLDKNRHTKDNKKS